MTVMFFAMLTLLGDKCGNLLLQGWVLYSFFVVAYAANKESLPFGKCAGDGVEEMGEKNIVIEPILWRVETWTVVEVTNSYVLNRHVEPVAMNGSNCRLQWQVTQIVICLNSAIAGSRTAKVC